MSLTIKKTKHTKIAVLATAILLCAVLFGVWGCLAYATVHHITGGDYYNYSFTNAIASCTINDAPFGSEESFSSILSSRNYMGIKTPVFRAQDGEYVCAPKNGTASCSLKKVLSLYRTYGKVLFLEIDDDLDVSDLILIRDELIKNLSYKQFYFIFSSARKAEETYNKVSKGIPLFVVSDTKLSIQWNKELGYNVIADGEKWTEKNVSDLHDKNHLVVADNVQTKEEAESLRLRKVDYIFVTSPIYE